MGVIERAFRAAWQELKKPASYVKGDQFELFLRHRLFPASHYTLLHKNHDYFTIKDFEIESSKEPDFKFISVKTELEFFVEAKYRSRFYSGRLEWCKTYQLRRYQVINKNTALFIAIGVGGLPTAPEHVFLIPMKDIKYTVFFHSFLRKYEVSASSQVPEADLKKFHDEIKPVLI